MKGYIDLHCDTLWCAIRHEQPTITRVADSMLDIERLKQAGVMAQFFALFIPQQARGEWAMKDGKPDLEEMMKRLHIVFMETMLENYGTMRFAGSFDDLVANARDGLMSAFLTVENGAVIDGNMDNIDRLYNMGVRLITLTWNDPNCLGQNHSADPVLMNTGLTSFGKEAVEVMNDKGIIVDVSHLSDGGFYDVASVSKKPFVASHSNCRSLCGATRNMTDEMIHILGEKGGVAGLNFCPQFLDEDPQHPVSRIEAMCDHVIHMINKGGIGSIAIGTDFDGIGGELEIKACTEMELLFDALQKRGLSEDALDLFKYGNVMRVLKETL